MNGGNSNFYCLRNLIVYGRRCILSFLSSGVSAIFMASVPVYAVGNFAVASAFAGFPWSRFLSTAVLPLVLCWMLPFVICLRLIFFRFAWVKPIVPSRYFGGAEKPALPAIRYPIFSFLKYWFFQLLLFLYYPGITTWFLQSYCFCLLPTFFSLLVCFTKK